MKTKTPSLDPIVVEILMARGSGHKILTESGTTRVVRKEVLLLKKQTRMTRMTRIRSQMVVPSSTLSEFKTLTGLKG